MKAKLRKGLPWILTTLLILAAIAFAVNTLGDGFHERGYAPPIINSNYNDNQSPVVQGNNPGRGDYSMYGHQHGDHAMREHHEGGFHFIEPAISFVFGLAALVVLIRWVRKRRTMHPFTQSIIDTPISYPVYTVNQNQPDFLDEWEKKQTNQKNHKEEE
ncbi:hypothetical protein [Aneurinibacillus tyrosinisolvens]|uniref:hypothetical protein n=1 Tax=Aneurinibacillus tyrosinisolvens TaxID=1443435 RepID=UPI00063F66DA|nr:hypothetical protein [Aneurinibacillus tyrosinisolvens]